MGTVSGRGDPRRPRGEAPWPRQALLTSRLVPGPPTGKPRELSSSMAPKI